MQADVGYTAAWAGVCSRRPFPALVTADAARANLRNSSLLRFVLVHPCVFLRGINLWRAVLYLPYRSRGDVQDLVSWCCHAKFIYVVRKISIESSERHLHHKIKTSQIAHFHIEQNQHVPIDIKNETDGNTIAYWLQFEKKAQWLNLNW